LIATGLFASPRLLSIAYENDDNPGLFYTFGQGKPNGILFACQLVTILFIVGWTLVTMLPFFFWLNYRGWFRSDSYEEIIGLDISYHGGGMRHTVDDGVGIQFVESHRKTRGEREALFRQQSDDQRSGCNTSSKETADLYSLRDEPVVALEHEHPAGDI
jgi:hypothetical protein